MAGKGGRIPGAGRKKGVPNRVTTEVRSIAQEYGREAIGKLVELMREAEFETVQVAAAKEILDRAYGKSMQPVQGEINHGVRYQVRLAFRDSPLDVHSADPDPDAPVLNGAETQH